MFSDSKSKAKYQRCMASPDLPGLIHTLSVKNKVFAAEHFTQFCFPNVPMFHKILHNIIRKFNSLALPTPLEKKSSYATDKHNGVTSSMGIKLTSDK